MTEPVRVLFVSPEDNRPIDTVRAQTDVVVERVANTAAAYDHLEDVDCVVCTMAISADVVSFLEDVRRSNPSMPCLLVSDDDTDVQHVLDENLAEWVPTAGRERVVENRVRRIVDRIQRDRRLSAVRAAQTRLSTAETDEYVAETAVTVAQTKLGYSASIVARYDSETGSLQPVEWSGIQEPDERLFDTDDGLGWNAFLNGETRTGYPGDEEDDQWLALPLGRYGVLVVTATHAERDETTTTMAEMLASNAESALNRLERERALATQRTTLADTEATLERTRRRESLVRDVCSALVQADTKTEIEHAACKRLTNADTYRFAWVGEYDTTTDELSGRTWVGDEQAFLEELATATEETSQTTTWTAIQTREPAIDDDLLGDPPYETWRQAALKRGYRAAISVPLIYRGSIYGVLTVYTSDPDTFDATERRLFEEIGNAMAYAINAVESKNALVSDSAVELEFRVRDPQFTVIKFVQMANCRFEFESVIRETDDTLRLFFTTKGTTPESVLAFSDQSLVVNDIRHITGDGDRHLFECTVTGSNVISLLLDHGAVPKTATAEGDEARLTVELPQSADIRRFVETFQNRYSDSELIARRKRNRPIQTEQDFRAQLQHRLTDRQSEALETAYWSGFFEWPRGSTGQEIAESIGVSQPTFNRHLRAAERNLLTALFEDV